MASTAKGRTVAIVDLIEAKAREQKMTVVPASDMANAIASTGRVARHGIHFDTDKADIRSESEDTLAQMAKLLKDCIAGAGCGAQPMPKEVS